MNDAPIMAVAFDLDGTLVDSAPDIGHALNTALRGNGLPPCALPRVREWIGDGPDVLIERALAAIGGEQARAADPALLRRAFDAATFDAPLAHGSVFDGIGAMLQQLAPRWPLVVITNKPTALARAVLQAAGLLRHFFSVHGADRAQWRKPAPALLEQAAAGLKLATRQLLMVGDGPADMRAASAAGARAALVGWGYAHAQALACEPHWLIEHPRDLPALMQVTQ